MIQGIHYLWFISVKEWLGFLDGEVQDDTCKDCVGFLSSFPDMSHLIMINGVSLAVALQSFIFFVVIREVVWTWFVHCRFPWSSDGGGEKEDLDEWHDLQGRKVSEDSLQGACQTKLKWDLPSKSTPPADDRNLISAHKKDDEAPPLILKRHILRFKKRSTQSAVMMMQNRWRVTISSPRCPSGTNGR